MKKEVKEEKTKTTRRRVVKKESEDQIVKSPTEFSLIEVIFIVLVTGIAVSIASGVLVYNNFDKINSKIVTANDGELSEFVENYNRILNNYVEEVDKDKLIEAAIGGMYNYIGDEYTMFIDDQTTSDLKEQLEGEYTGIGVEITTMTDKETPYVKVNKVFKNSPAEKSGIKAGDIITKVDGVEMKDASTLSDTVKKGAKESYEITYIRDGKEKTLTLKRERVVINTVESKEYDTVGYIKVDTFSYTTEAQIKECLDKFNKKINSLVIDVRNNTGGSLDSAYNVSDLFLEKGKNIYQMKERDKEAEIYKARTGVYRKFDKIVVLVNGSSASASEILALALKESARATIVGVRTYGKGTVQETGTLSSGAMVKYTKAYWLSPNGKSINKEGIVPDIEEKDANKQLEKALKAAK